MLARVGFLYKFKRAHVVPSYIRPRHDNERTLQPDIRTRGSSQLSTGIWSGRAIGCYALMGASLVWRNCHSDKECPTSLFADHGYSG